jgi:hypothetical protein
MMKNNRRKVGIVDYEFGHAIRGGPRRYFYVDTGKMVKCPWERPCPKCGHYRTKDKHDPCIANLPGVRNACCGHGVEESYVQFENGMVICGWFEVDRFRW